MKRTRTIASLLLALASLQAHAVGQLADVQVIDRHTGTELPLHYHAGSYWVAGTPGARYAIALRSRQSQRLLAVTAVDGVNVVSGETASWAQGGYVLSPRQRTRITGWRKSDREVAGFEFALADASYAARTGRAGHLGVIGVALFHEKLPEPEPQAGALFPPESKRLWDSLDSARREAPAGADSPAAAGAAARPDASALAARESSADSAAASRAPAPSARLGTGHGEREVSRVVHTRFERQRDFPDETIVIRYDSRENLIASGVIPAPVLQQPRAHPFPLSEQARYVPDPPPMRY